MTNQTQFTVPLEILSHQLFALQGPDSHDLEYHKQFKTDPADAFAGYVTCLTHHLEEHLRDTFGFTLTEDRKSLTFNTDTFDAITEIAEAIQEEYDSLNDESPTWDKFKLSGDCDVDYNGTYLDFAIATCRAYAYVQNHFSLA